MSSAAEKLKALDGAKTFNPMHLWNALPQIVAVVEALETATDWYDRAAHSRPRPDWIESGGVALAALDERLGDLGSPPTSEGSTAP